MACCGKNDADPNNINTDQFGKGHDYLHQADKIKTIIRIQAAFRGYMARKRVRSLRFSGGGRTMMHAANYNGVANYENPEVLVCLY